MAQITVHTVKSGDTLSKIARDVLGDISQWEAIARLNNIVAPYTIFPGMQLMLPDTDVPGPVVVPREPPRPTTTAPVPRQAGPSVVDIVAGVNPYVWYLVAGAVLLFLLMDRKQ